MWLEGLPAETGQLKGKFRADQLFEPNADGADMIIPEITFKIQAPASLTPQTYPIRVLGCATAEESRPDRRIVEGHTAMMRGPLLDIWNFTRRPLASIGMTLLPPFDAKLVPESRNLRVEQGKSVQQTLKLENVPEAAVTDLFDLPRGVTARSLGRKGDRETIVFEAATDADPGTFAISAAALVVNRRVSAPITLTIEMRN